MATVQQGRYSGVARWLHWIIAIFVILNLVSGIGHEALPRDQRGAVMALHFSSGMTILALSLARLLWRLGHRPPPLPDGMKGWEIKLAGATHAVLYLLMIVLPLSGWVIVSTAPFPIQWFGLFALPKFGVTREDALAGLAGEGHEILGFVMLALVLLHVAAALYHQYGRKDGLMGRMLW